MKKLLSVCAIIAVLFSSMFILSGCGDKNTSKKQKKEENVESNNSVVANNTAEGNNTTSNSTENQVAQTQLDKTPVDFKNKDTYYFLLNGKKYNITNKINDIVSAGFQISKTDAEQNVPSKRYMIGGGYIKNSDNRTVFSVTPINLGAETVKEGEATIGGFSLDKYYVENLKGTISICNGITIGTAEEDLVSIFGEPTEKDMREDYANLGMLYKYKVGAYKYFEFEVDKTTKKITKITWRYFDL